MADLGVEKFACILQYLDPMPPVTKELDKWGSRYPSQKAHMIAWFSSQVTTGSGAYTRKQGNFSSIEAYNRLMNPGALLWMAESLGMDESTLRRAVKAAVEEERTNVRGRCRAFREVIGWDDLYPLIADPSGWLIDPAVKDFLSWWKGWPSVKIKCQEDFDRVIVGEFERKTAL